MQSSRERVVSVALFGVITLVLACFPLLGASGRMTNLATLSAMWATAVYGLYLCYALAGQVTAASVTVWAAAAFSVALAAKNWAPPLPVLFLIGVLAGFIAGAILALPVLRTSGHYFVVVTFAAVELSVVLGRNWDLIDNKTAGVFVFYKPTLGPWHLKRLQDSLWLACACLTLAFLAVALLSASRLGRRWVAVRENEQLAATVGCRVRLYKALVLALGGAITGMAGVLPTVLSNHVQMSDYAMETSIVFFIVLIVGGRRTIVGPIAGALFWFLGPELIGLEPLLSQAVFGAVLAATIIVMPDGILVGVQKMVGFAVRQLHKRSRYTRMGPRITPEDDEGVPSGVERLATTPSFAGEVQGG